MNQALMALITTISAGYAISEADQLFVKAEEEARQEIIQYDAVKRSEYDQICRLMSCIKTEDGRYVVK